MGLCFGRFCNHQQPRRVFVDTVYQSQPGIVYIVVGRIPEIVGQSVYQCAAVISVSRVYDQSGRFVYHQHGVVLIHNIEGYILWDNFEFVAWAIHHDRNNIERFHPIVRFHGLPIDQVHFHEVGAIDSIVDIISTAVLVDDLQPDRVIVSPLSEGRGYVRCQRGVMPVPVPATAGIAAAHGLKLRLTDNEGEMVTPTGAAIAAALSSGDELPQGYVIRKVGVGAGNKDFANANILRAMILEPDGNRQDSLWVLESNIDDCSGEALGFVMERLLEQGAKDVWHTPIYMKKNRPAVLLSVLCREEEREKLEESIFLNTTTIGIRRYPVERTELERSQIQVETPWGGAQAKVCRRGDYTRVAPEYESVRKICREQGLPYEQVYRAVWKAGEEQA